MFQAMTFRFRTCFLTHKSLCFIITVFASASMLIGKIQPNAQARPSKFLPSVQQPAIEQNPTALELGKALERELAGGQKHDYQITLTEGQYARLLVEQRGLDVEVRILKTDGTLIAEFDSESRTQGQEIVELVADTSGNYKLIVGAKYQGVVAGRYEIRLAELHVSTESERALQEARTLTAKSLQLYLTNRADEAIPLAERALEIRKQALDPESLELAESLNHLARIYTTKGIFLRAEPLLQRALSIHEKVLDARHPALALTLNHLAILYRRQGDYARAESTFQRALTISETTLGADHPNVAQILKEFSLWGTKLVTLSACDTGVGDVKNGEGVYGLRRAFVLAGAETLVMSLWPVSDYVTRELMTSYYKNLKQGLGRGEALRQVQLQMLRRKEREHPFYWASFIQAGEWANLDGKRKNLK